MRVLTTCSCRTKRQEMARTPIVTDNKECTTHSITCMCCAPSYTYRVYRGFAMQHSVLCDCHYVPMQYQAVLLVPTGSTIRCWISDCGRYYARSLGYFHLHSPTAGTKNSIDNQTCSAKPCGSESCTGKRFMAIVCSTDATGARSECYWYCFQCRTQVQFDNAKGLGSDRRGAA
jgi:hypothetical protein